ncbi:hypothetical protein GCM10027321_19370 [Massilia terrae]|uniref:FecR domain-containing protein n=1 Tax=Massilia terrae TaxID=1811224 RepID=A0ABT2CWN8_9BURK|nr:FecR family protein [Massilia terrae]MCS0658398.1 FecR domain-containing protein [Massilia terrae]
MLRRLILVCSVAVAAQVHAAEAGKVIFTAGASHIADRAAAEGAPVNEGDLLTTGDDGYLYVKTVDNGLFVLRPNTKAKIVTYQVDSKNPANTHVKLELISGVARSKSGDAVKLARQNFRFNTPVAAIGVRGTDFTVHTDADTSRVSVLTGRVIVTGFGGACTPEGGGPCEGATSRELSAAQRGQLLQIKRGQPAPQLMSSVTNSPDQVSPPRGDEPLAKASTNSDPAIDAKKTDSLDKIVARPPVTAPPVVDNVPPPITTPSAPQREIQWGRWVQVLNQPANIAFSVPDGAERLFQGPFMIVRTAGEDYVTPERGSVAFNLKGSEAYIFSDDPTKSAVAAAVKNGTLSFDFDKATFNTGFDLVSGSETFKMTSTGTVTSDGHFNTSNDSLFTLKSNTDVSGVLSNQNGGSAAYLFQRRLDDTRTTQGVTFWSR